MKRLILIAAVMTATAVAHAGPHGGPGGFGGGPRPGGPGFPARCPPPSRHHGGWGRGGCEFWPGFVGGVIGGAIAARTVVEPAPVVVAAPTVVTTPVVTTPVVVQPAVVTPVTQVQNVWVEGRYVDQVQANGSVIRVWSPGHYEQRTVVIQ